jgi:type II secretory pathway pseudopilin PulG
MMIVIGIIALLAALTLGISSSVMRNSEIRKTEDVLKLMTMALQEWELERGRSVTFEGYIPVPNGMYDVWTNGEYIDAPSFSEQGLIDALMLHAMKTRIETTVDVLMQSESAHDILSKILPEHSCRTSGSAPNEVHTSELCTVDDEHGKIVVDAWGTPIGVVFPGRNFAEANLDATQPPFAQDLSGDQTVRDQVEDGLGSCINARPYFVSAGPDRLWGYRFQSNDVNSVPDNEKWAASIDNIYSYEPFLVESAR